jgi:hypothetical protein
MSEQAQELARIISDELWDKYDDTYGYRSEKQEANANFNKHHHPDNIWSFWGQFDSTNHQLFTLSALMAKHDNVPGGDELYAWAHEQLAEEQKVIDDLNERGIVF